MSRFDMTPEEVAAYERGWRKGYVRGWRNGLEAARVLSRPFDSDRVRAFGAIRRAAEVARNADMTWEEWDTYIDPDVSIPAFQEGVRRAIRAAIGSEKK